MKVHSIDTINLDEGGLAIDSVLVKLTAAELFLILRYVGSRPSTEYDTVMPQGGVVAHEIYDGASDVVNRFYDDGIDEAIRSLT